MFGGDTFHGQHGMFWQLKVRVRYWFIYCLCSKDCVNWGLLSPAHAETITKARMMTGRFTGDPSYECEHRSETEEDVVVRIHTFCNS